MRGGGGGGLDGRRRYRTLASHSVRRRTNTESCSPQCGGAFLRGGEFCGAATATVSSP